MMHESAGVSSASLPPVISNGHHGNGHGARPLPERQPMHVELNFCPPHTDPFDTVDWEYRTAQIKDENGKVLFEQVDCEIPSFWSPLATNVVVSKYFYGEHGTAERERSVKQVVHRVARTIADWGIEDG